jgi:four helix bundle protein
MAKGDDIQERLVLFALAILQLADHLPKDAIGRHVSSQLHRSGSSVATNYSEARGAESRKDFVHKLGIVLKELNESRVWLEIICRRKMLDSNEVDQALDECIQLSKIIAVSRRTARGKK